MILVDVFPLTTMAIMLFVALIRGAASVSHRELWQQPPRQTAQPQRSPAADHMVGAV